MTVLANSVLFVLLVASTVAAADLNGIWTGFHEGRRGEKEDVAFRFRTDGQTLTGKLFGDEFDLPITAGVIEGDQVRFSVITTNYYSGAKVTFTYAGSIRDGELELVRERVLLPEEKPDPNRPPAKQTI